MSYYSEKEREQSKAEAIRRKYLSRKENKLDELRKLDNKVKAPGRIIACFLGVVGALVMGAGMSLVMVWSDMTMGLALGIPGLLAVLLACPVYRCITGRRKKKYAAAIMRLSDDLMRG